MFHTLAVGKMFAFYRGITVSKVVQNIMQWKNLSTKINRHIHKHINNELDALHCSQPSLITNHRNTNIPLQQQLAAEAHESNGSSKNDKIKLA